MLGGHVLYPSLYVNMFRLWSCAFSEFDLGEAGA